MKLFFCTLFDSKYLSRGLAMYESLKQHCPDFQLYIFPFDEKCFSVLQKMNLPNVTLISLKDFENEELLKAKSNRSQIEYCWTCSSSTILYVLEKYKTEHCTYIDSDLYFYSSPEVLVDEMKNDSALITEHRYTPKYDKSKISGKYCVQFITIKNDERGLRVLNWWRNACIDWCYNRSEDGKFGDQKYLDDWTKRFEGVHVLQHLGGGVALWNVQQYQLENKNQRLFGKEIKTGKEFPIIFYHFHYLRFYNNGLIDLGRYTFPDGLKDFFYLPYLSHLEKVKKQIQQIDHSFDPHGPVLPRRDWFTPFRYLLRKFQHTYNIYKKEELLYQR